MAGGQTWIPACPGVTWSGAIPSWVVEQGMVKLAMVRGLRARIARLGKAVRLAGDMTAEAREDRQPARRGSNGVKVWPSEGRLFSAQ